MEGNMVKEIKIAFIGAGSMAEAMISGLLQKNTIHANQIIVSNRGNLSKLKKLEETYGIQTSTSKKVVVDEADVVILAMKPKDIIEGLLSIRSYLNSQKLLISVIAGVSMELIKNTVETEIPLIRAMPNTSSSIGFSATTIAASDDVNEEQMEIATSILQAIGTVMIVEEDELHITTGLAGSGPAYLYYIAEGMERTALDLGLDKKITRQLIAQTFIGAGQMLLNNNLDLTTLRENVTSPGGTTEAGINQLELGHVKEVFQTCVKSAIDRSRELEAIAAANQLDKNKID